MADPTVRTGKLWEQPLLQGMILIVLAVLAYSNTFHVPFVLDDAWITNNSVIHDLGSFFTADGYDEFPNRVIGYFTMGLNYHFGGENVVGYHVVNLAIHVTNSLLVYSLVRLTLQTPLFRGLETEMQGPGTGDWGLGKPLLPAPGPRSLVPFFTALLFVCHPVQTQAVTYIVQRLTSLATLFYLASLVLHVRWRLARQYGSPFVSWSVLPWWLLSLTCAILAMKTKEIAFTLPLVVILYEFSFFGRPDRKVLLSLIPMLLTLVIIPLGMLSLEKPAGEILSDVRTVSADQFAMTRGVYLTTQFSVVTTYLRLLVLPVNQNLDYEYPLNHSLLEPRAILSLFLLLALVAAAVKLWRIKSSSEFRVPSPESRLFRLAAFGIFWFFLTLSVESSIIPIRDVMFEHRLYLPSVGFLIAGVSLVLVAAQRLSVRFSHAGTAAALILCLAALVLAGATFARNSVWRTEETLWKDSIRKSPGKARPWNNLGVTLAKQKRLTEAIHAMETAVRLDPYYLDGRLNLGQAYAEAERFTDAERELRIAAGLSLPGDNAAREALQELHRVLAARRALLRRNEEP